MPQLTRMSVRTLCIARAVERIDYGPEIIVVDTRNDFEVKLGTFQGAENPDTRSLERFRSGLIKI